jgi:hypothetical protein
MPTDEGLSRLTVDIPEGLHRRLKVLAAQLGTEIRVLVAASLEETLPPPSGSVRQVTPAFMARLRPLKSKKGGRDAR